MDHTKHEEVMEFLAQLDYLVEGPKTWSLQDEDLDEKINKVLDRICENLCHRYSVHYVRDRLWKEFRRSYTYAAYNFPNLFLHGSYEMKTLDSNARTILRKRVGEIRLQQALSQETRSCRTRSVLSASIAIPSRSRTKTPTLASPLRRPREKKGRRTSTQTRARCNKKAPLKVASRIKSNPQKHTTHPADAVSRDELDEKPFHQLSTSQHPTDVATAAPSSDGMSAQLSKQIPHDHFENRNDPTGLERHRTTCGSHLSANTLAEDHKATVIALAQYKNRCQKLEKDRANLKTELRRTTSIFAQANGIDKELMRKVRSQTRDVIELKSRLQEIDSLEPYMALGQAHDVALTTEKLHLDFQIMKNELGSLPVLNAGRQISVESLYGQSDDLDLLLHTILHSNTESNAESVPKAGPTFALREVIQALTGAAVKVWAFESTLGLTSMMTTPLLQKYRDHIATMCGQEGLCNLDFAAHDAMIQGKDFEENTIAPVASRLTKRLLNVLRLVIGHQDAHETLKRLGPRLACIMKPAIHLRSLSLVSAKRLESIWPSPGASLEELEMSVEPPLEARTGDLVRLPILPGLRAYHNEKEMISYRGFGDSNLASGHPDHTIKALVIV